MKSLSEALKGNFTIVNLGCIADPSYPLPRSIEQILTVIEVDAAGSSHTKNNYYRKIGIQKAISGSPGKRVFRTNSFVGTCSLLEPKAEMVTAFGMERYCRLIHRTEVECETLPNILQAGQVTGIDFLKTDLEGLDFEIIRSCEALLGRILCIQCELRFLPFYETETAFQEVASYLARFGYELLDITHIDRWKYKTPHWQFQVEGRAVWGDFLFVLQPDRLADVRPDALAETVAKQIILTCMLGKKNYAEFLLQRFQTALPETWARELEQFVKPRFPGVQPALRGLRRIFRPIELFLKHRIDRSRHVAIR